MSVITDVDSPLQSTPFLAAAPLADEPNTGKTIKVVKNTIQHSDVLAQNNGTSKLSGNNVHPIVLPAGGNERSAQLLETKEQKQLPIDSKRHLIVRIIGYVCSLFQNLYGLFIPKLKSKEDLIKHAHQICTAAKSKLNNECMNLEKRLKKKLNPYKIQAEKTCKEIHAIFETVKVNKLLEPKTDTLKKEQLEKHKEALTKTLKTVIKQKKQAEQIVNNEEKIVNLANQIFNYAEKKVIDIADYNITKLDSICNNHSTLELDADITPLKIQLNKIPSQIYEPFDKIVGSLKDCKTQVQELSQKLEDLDRNIQQKLKELDIAIAQK